VTVAGDRETPSPIMDRGGEDSATRQVSGLAAGERGGRASPGRKRYFAHFARV
jgi:hypothetical protein